MHPEDGLDPWRHQFERALERGDEAFVARKLDAWSREGAVQEHAYSAYYDRLSPSTCAAFPHLARHRAQRALERERVVEALDWLEIARSSLQSEDATTAVDLSIDEALILREDGRWQESIALLDRVERESVLLDRQKLRVANMRAVIAISSQHDYPLAANLFESIVDLSQKQSDKTSLLTALINQALSVHRFSGRFDRMLEAADEIVRIYRGDVPDIDRIYVARIRARAAVESCHPEASALAQGYLDEARVSPWAKGDALVFSAFDRLNSALGSHRKAYDDESVQDVLSRLREVELQVTPTSVDLMLASAARLRAEAMGSIESTSSTVDQFARRVHHEPFWRCWGLCEQAHSCLISGDRARVEEVAGEALALAEQHGFGFERFLATVILAASSGSPKRCWAAIRLMQEGGYERVLLVRFAPYAELVLQGSLSISSDPSFEAGLLDALGSQAIRVSVFGGLVVWIGARRLTDKDWGRPRSRALFAYLVLRSGTAATYDEAACALWPDLNEKMARQSLLNALTHLRKALGTSIVDTGHNLIRLRSDLWIDLKLLLASKNPDESLRELAEQPLLPEYAYEDWFADQRIELEGRIQGLMTH
ncbi:MAG: hypothetical protein K1X67_04375 [Fimbriimonadaceae bacterium]|nr:hypothetical protein [Fimbriimonadaceae bacterium]